MVLRRTAHDVCEGEKPKSVGERDEALAYAPSDERAHAVTPAEERTPLAAETTGGERGEALAYAPSDERAHAVAPSEEKTPLAAETTGGERGIQ